MAASHCPVQPVRLRRTSRSKGWPRSSRSLASSPCCSRSSGEHLGVHVGPESDKSAPTHPQEGTEIGVMDDLQVPEKELRCEACGRVIKPERDEKVERD